MSSAQKEKMTITVCDADKNLDSGKSFEFMLNPSEYNHSRGVDYSDNEAIGQSAANTRFSRAKPEELKFSTLLDGTGVVPAPEGTPKEVKDQLEALRKIVYDYDGEKHEPNHVRVLWGSQIFYGRLDSMDVSNTLFKPSGEPLRAKLQMVFKSFLSDEEEAKKANRSSPDLSHLVEVKAGDTLPLLCQRIYKDSSYYLEVARVNRLTSFRDLRPGSKLHFPPLR